MQDKNCACKNNSKQAFKKSTRRNATKVGVPHPTFFKIIKEDSPIRCNCSLGFTKMILIGARKGNVCMVLESDWIAIPSCALLRDEAPFYINAKLNTQNVRFWSETNPH